MVASQNGWRANDPSVIASIAVPGGKLAVRRGDIGTIFQHLATRFHYEVEPLVWPGNWGYASRVIRGGVALSNHASGTAIDLNAPQHPLGTNPAANYSGAEIAKILEIVAFYEGIIRWGGSYTGRKDGMHFEINDGITEAQVARIAAKVRGGAVPAPVPAPAPAPPASFDPNSLMTLSYGMQNEQVKSLQRFLNAYNWVPALPLLPVTGGYFDQTASVIHRAGAQMGVVGDSNGHDVGPQFKRAFAARGARW